MSDSMRTAVVAMARFIGAEHQWEAFRGDNFGMSASEQNAAKLFEFLAELSKTDPQVADAIAEGRRAP